MLLDSSIIACNLHSAHVHPRKRGTSSMAQLLQHDGVALSIHCGQLHMSYKIVCCPKSANRTAVDTAWLLQMMPVWPHVWMLRWFELKGIPLHEHRSLSLFVAIHNNAHVSSAVAARTIRVKS
eukprot:1521342-Amphidinium_carterae.1